LDSRFSSRSEFFAGIRAELPILIGVAPFGVIYGVLAINAGLPANVAQAMSAIIFAGSSQFIFTQMVSAGTPALIMILTVGIINLRHALYSASIAPYLQNLSSLWKVILAYLLTDEAYAVSILHFRDEGDGKFRHWYLLGAGLALWSCWQISTAVGILIGSVIPESWPLDFTLALTFIALLIPSLKDRPSIASVLVSGFLAVLAYSLPFKSGLILAALGGVLAGLLVERWK
jgi:4-azaleucine resistance transporter AzlC